MNKAERWKELKEQFTLLGVAQWMRDGDLSAFFGVAPDSPAEWKLQDTNEAIIQQFKVLGTKAGKLLGCNNQKPLDAWLEALRERLVSRGELSTADLGTCLIGTIFHVAQESAGYCAELELKALEEEDGPAESTEAESGLEASQSSATNTSKDPVPSRERLKLDEARKQFRIDDTWIDYAGDHAAYFLAVLLKAAGGWEPGTNLVSDKRTRADRIFKSLPKEIQDIIKTQRGGTGGYRFKPEYFR